MDGANVVVVDADVLDDSLFVMVSKIKIIARPNPSTQLFSVLTFY